MRLETQNFLRHQCLLSIFSVCYLYSVFYICSQVFILLSISLLFITWEILYLEGRKFEFKLVLKEDKIFIRCVLCQLCWRKNSCAEAHLWSFKDLTFSVEVLFSFLAPSCFGR